MSVRNTFYILLIKRDEAKCFTIRYPGYTSPKQ